MTTSNNGKGNGKFFMAGTEGTGEYIVPLVTNRGAVGFRFLGGQTYRVRIEPATGADGVAMAATFPRPGFKQPGDSGQERFSTMVYTVRDLYRVVGDAIAELCRGATDADINQAAPSWSKDLAESNIPDEVKANLVAMIQTLGLPGANLASTWKYGTLAAKLAGTTVDETIKARIVAKLQDRKVPGANLASTWSVASVLSKVAPAAVVAKVGAQSA